MDKFILKDKLKELLEGCTVKSALFYTFNFDPRFFENYIMPLLVTGNEFNDESIHNKILWRKYQRDSLIPPITVYCDYFAKNNSEAPTLGYDVFCVRMPFAKGKICNFHPKHIIIELEDSDGKQKILFITGSGNLTPGGWCDNFEVFSVKYISRDRTTPMRSTKNLLQKMINQVSALKGSDGLSSAEQRIYNFLNYVKFDDKFKKKFKYHYSGHSNFNDFLKDNIGSDIITEIEIISPYFSNHIRLLSLLRAFNDPIIKILIPTLRSNEVILKKEIFDLLKENNVQWCKWANSEYNGEVRNLHAKLYRFYSDQMVYTIVGSVNFTEPAWSSLKELNNNANMESAMLYIEPNAENNRILKPASENEISKLQFVIVEDPEDNEGDLADRNAPIVTFTLDWKLRTLNYVAKDTVKGCQFEKVLQNIPLVKGIQKKVLSDEDIKLLTGNSLITLSVTTGEKSQYYTYYPTQLNIENKPLDFKLSVLNVLDFWNFLGDEYQSNRLSRIIAEMITDESGIVHEELAQRPSILNEMATYFNSFIKLERYLFKERRTIEEKKAQFRDLNYYLLSENIDTVSYCLKSLKEKVNDGKLKSLYWMLLQILINNFYERAKKQVYTDTFNDDGHTIGTFKQDLQTEITKLKAEAKSVLGSIDGLKEKETWVIKELKKTYAG